MCIRDRYKSDCNRSCRFCRCTEELRSPAGLQCRRKAGVHKMVMDLGPNGKHVAGCHVRFRHEDVSAAGGTSFAGRPHPSHTLVGFTIRAEDDTITSLKLICGWCQPKRDVQNRGGCAFIRSRTRQNAKRIFSRAYALGSSPEEEPKHLSRREIR